jgi:flagellar motility protein MotE (MotC chaperone)
VKNYLILAAALTGSFAVTFGTMYFAMRGKASHVVKQAVPSTVDPSAEVNPVVTLGDSIRREEAEWEDRIEAFRKAMFDVDSLQAVGDSLMKEINERLSRLASVTAKVEKAEALLQTIQDERVKKLAGIFGSMQAASIDSMAARIDDEVMVAVLLEMRERSAAKVLAALTPSRAARIARKMTVDLR